MKESLRKVVKQVLASLIYYSGFLNLHLHLRRKLSGRTDFAILMYHQVLKVEQNMENHLPSGMLTLENTFDSQMKYLKKHFNVIALDQLTECLSRRKNPPVRSVVVTFDDGWRDTYLFAFPILKKHGLPATVFLSTDYIGTSKVFWFQVASLILRAEALSSQDMAEILNGFEQISPEEKRAIVDSLTYADVFIERLKRIKPHVLQKLIVEMVKKSGIQISQMGKRRRMLDWEEIKEMAENEISFGSHACSHRILTQLDWEEIKTELTESKKAIEEKTKRPASFFAYPNGDYTSPIKELVKQTGYLSACVAEWMRTKQDDVDLFALPRIGIHEGISTGITGEFSRALFACQVAGLFNRRRRRYEQSVGD